MSINYEAVGRYVTADEKIKELLRQQSETVQKIEVVMLKTKNSYEATCVIRKIETARLSELVAHLNKIHSDLTELIHEANLYADDADKPKIRLID